MSVWASGSIYMTAKETIPEELITGLKECGLSVGRTKHDYIFEFDGNWYLEDLIDTISVFNPYLKSGTIHYHDDDGHAQAIFTGDGWKEEWEQYYYESDLPNHSISSTERVKNILNTIAEELMDGSDSGEAVRILLGECKLTDEEVRLYGLDWLKDLA